LPWVVHESNSQASGGFWKAQLLQSRHGRPPNACTSVWRAPRSIQICRRTTWSILGAGLIRDTWEFALFVNNVIDERALLALDRERGTGARVGFLTNQPHTGGVTLRFNY